jgi:Mg-chelatase subunit ChlD
VSADVGELDETAFEGVLGESPDEALALLADLTAATDPELRRLARLLAGRITVDLARRASDRGRRTGSMRTMRMDDSAGEVDVEASIDALVGLRAGLPIERDDLRVRRWSRATTAICLVVDRSGSMGGEPLATAALAAAAAATREPDDYSVVMFSNESVIVKSQDEHRSAADVVDRVLALRGFGTTDLAGAMRAAREQLARSGATHKVVVLLSDCRATDRDAAASAAAGFVDFLIIAPASDAEEARAFADSVGARFATVSGPSDVPAAFAALLD